MKRTILLVEDDEDIRTAFREILEAYDYVVEEAGNGREAIDFLQSTNRYPHLILLDIKMPVMSGLEFYKIVSEDNVLKNIPIIVMTATGKIEELCNGDKFFDCLGKPINIDEILNSLNRFFEGSGEPRTQA